MAGARRVPGPANARRGVEQSRLGVFDEVASGIAKDRRKKQESSKYLLQTAKALINITAPFPRSGVAG